MHETLVWANASKLCDICITRRPFLVFCALTSFSQQFPVWGSSLAWRLSDHYRVMCVVKIVCPR